MGYFLNMHYGAYGELYLETYYGMGLYGNVILTFYALFWLSLCYALSGYIPDSIRKIMENCSRNITYIYLLQYIFIINLQVFILGEDVRFGRVEVFVFTVLIFVICYLISQAICKYKMQRRMNK